ARQCPAQKPATSDPCERQGQCFYGEPPFRTPCECVSGLWQCHECPASSPSGACPSGAAGLLCAYGNVQCGCQTPSPPNPGTWHCNACPTSAPTGNCSPDDYCGYAPNTGCFCARDGTWGCIGPPSATN